MAAYASLGLRLTKFDFNERTSDAQSCAGKCDEMRLMGWGQRGLGFGTKDAIIRGVLFVPIFTKFLTQMHRDALSANPAAASAIIVNRQGLSLTGFASPGANHQILRLQTDGNAGLHRIPNVHPAAWQNAPEDMPMYVQERPHDDKARPHWTDLLQEGVASKRGQRQGICGLLHMHRCLLSAFGVLRCPQASSRSRLNHMSEVSGSLLRLHCPSMGPAV